VLNNTLIRLALIASAIAATSCGIIKHNVNITLNSSSVFTITSTPPSVSGTTTTPITISPSSAGTDYTSNQSHVDKATLESITFTVTPHPDNQATQLTAATITVTDTTANSGPQVFTLGAPLVFVSGADGGSSSNVETTITSFSPDPTSVVTGLFKTGDSFTLSASGTADQSPVDIDVTVNVAVQLEVGEP
jgi:hypothetical protein